MLKLYKHRKNIFRFILFGFSLLYSAMSSNRMLGVDLASATPWEVVSSSEKYSNPHSPFWLNANRIGFITEASGKEQSTGGVFVIDLQASNIELLLSRKVASATYLRPVNQLAFLAIGKNGVLTIFTKKLDDRDITEYDTGIFSVFTPAWSSDGRLVVFAYPSYDSDLYLTNIQTGITTRLENLGRGKDTSGTDSPDFAPGNNEVVFRGWHVTSRIRKGGYFPQTSHIFATNVNTKEFQRLTAGPFQDRSPACSPNGKQIAFISNRTNTDELWLMDRDGRNLRKLTSLVQKGRMAGIDRPAWSPDQKAIALTVVPSSATRREDGFPYEKSSIWKIEVH